MTVHAAKGLEFGVVAVADLGRRLQLGWTPLRVTPGEEGPDAGEATRVGVQLGRLGRPSERLHDYEELTELAAEREAEEEGRLAYVAATRAKRRLILSGTFKPKAVESKPGRRDPISQQLIGALLDGNLEEREVEVPAAEAEGAPAGRLAVRVSSPAPGAAPSCSSLANRSPRSRCASGATPPLGRPSVPPALIGGLSYSALSDFERCGYRFYVERVLGIAEPEQPRAGSGAANGAPGGARQVRFRGRRPRSARVERPPRLARARPRSGRRRRLREQGLDDPALSRAGRRSGRGLARLAAAGRARRGPGRGRGPLRALGRRHPGPRLDRPAGRAATDGSVLVVDYKTDRLDGGDPASWRAATRSSATSTRSPPPVGAPR